MLRKSLMELIITILLVLVVLGGIIFIVFNDCPPSVFTMIILSLILLPVFMYYVRITEPKYEIKNGQYYKVMRVMVKEQKACLYFYELGVMKTFIVDTTYFSPDVSNVSTDDEYVCVIIKKKKKLCLSRPA